MTQRMQHGRNGKKRRRNITKVRGLQAFYIEENEPIPQTSQRNEFSLFRETEENEDKRKLNYIDPYFPVSASVSTKETQKRKIRNPYLLSKTSLTRVRQVVFLGSFVGTMPFNWNKKANKFIPWNPNHTWRFIFWRLYFISTLFLFFFQIYVFVKHMQEPGSNYRTIFMNSFVVFWYMYCVYFNTNMYLYAEEIRIYLNGLLFMNQSLVDKYVVHLDGFSDGCGMVNSVVIPFNFCQNGICVIFFILYPFQPWYLYSYIYDKGNPLAWYWLIPGAVHEFVTIGQTISNFSFFCWLSVAHIQSVKFWLQESHMGYESEHTRNNLRLKAEAFMVYRTLQALCKSFNYSVGCIAIPCLKITVMTACVPCAYVMIRSLNEKFINEFPAILTYPFGFILCSIGGFTFLSSAAQMNDLASGFVNSWEKTKVLETKRFLKSCNPVEVRVAEFYAITVSTTKTYFYIMFDYITDCIITFQVV